MFQNPDMKIIPDEIMWMPRPNRILLLVGRIIKRNSKVFVTVGLDRGQPRPIETGHQDKIADVGRKSDILLTVTKTAPRQRYDVDDGRLHLRIVIRISTG